MEACSQLIAAKGQVLCAGNDHLWSLDDAGHPKWTPVDLFNGSDAGTDVAVVVDNRLYAFGRLEHYDGDRVAAVGIDDGHIYWDATPSDEIPSFRAVGVVDGVLYLAGPKLWAVDLASRKTLGEYPLPTNQELALVPPTGSRWLFRGPSSGSDTVVRLQAYDVPRGGRPAPGWQRELPAGHGSGAVCFAAGRIVCAGDQLFALDPATGTQVWASKETGNFQYPTASPDGSLVFVADLDTLYAFDAATGALRWQTEQPVDRTAGPVVGIAYAEASRPKCADGNVYVLDDKSVLWALDPATSAVRWKYSGAKHADEFQNRVVWAAGGGRVYLADPGAQTIVSLSATGH